jgi:transcriptional regulator with XRE-family HTH domain
MTTAIQVNIKRQLHAKNMTAAELERRTGIPHAVVNILHGRSKNPSIRTAQAIAKELGCSVEDLFAEEPEQSNTTDSNHNWNSELYTDVFNTIMTCIQKSKLQPQPETIATWLTEVYQYTLGSPEHKVDLRFVEWLLGRAG